MVDLKLLPQAERLISGVLNADLTDVATTASVNNPPSSSKLPTYFEFDYGTDDAEVVRVISVSGNTITIERGINTGGVGIAHGQNTGYKQKITSAAWSDIVDAFEAGYLSEDTSYTFTRVTTSSFKVTASGVDRTGHYTTGRRVRLNGSVIVHVSSSSYSNPDTTVTVRETTVPATITSIELEMGTKGNFVDTELEHNADGTHKSALVTTLKASGAEVTTGTEDAKIVTPKAIKDAGIVAVTLPVKATGAEIITGTDDAKFATPKAIKDAADALITLTDVTTNDVSTTKHGLVPKAPNDTTKFLRGDGTWNVPAGGSGDMSYANSRFKAGVITRDLTLATGDVSYTGVGFTPKAIIFFAAFAAVDWASWGFSDGSSHISVDREADAKFYPNTPNFAFTVGSGAGAYQKAIVKTFDADGFTLTWTKVNSPTGTGTVMYLALR